MNRADEEAMYRLRRESLRAIVEETDRLDENCHEELDSAEDSHEELAQYALIEFDDVTRHTWISTHESLESIAAYKEDDDSGYEPERVVDLDSGRQYTPVPTTTWAFKAKDVATGQAHQPAREDPA